MASIQLSSAVAIFAWLSDHVTKGESMTRPYARK